MDAAVVDAAPPDVAPLDAAGSAGKYVQIGSCPDGGYMVDFNCPEFLTTPGMPALDSTKQKIAVPWDDEVGLGTLPNLEVWVLSASDGHKLDTLPMWSYAESRSFAKIMEGKNQPDEMKKLVASISARASKLEAELANSGYEPIPHCQLVEASAPHPYPYCGGYDQWTCGDLTVSYKKATHTSLTLTANGKTTTINTKAWRLPPVDIVGGDEKMKIPTINCITDAARIPGTTKVVIKLTHICDVSGDWCSVGGPTWHVVAMH